MRFYVLQEGSGWLRRSGRGDLFVTDVPIARFEEFNYEFARKILETHDWLVSILEGPEEPGARPPDNRRKP